MLVLQLLDILLMVLGTGALIYQVVYILVALLAKPRVFPEAAKDQRFAVLVSARNEENVLPHLIASLRANDYPQNLIDIWVVADNCSDNTAQVVKNLGEHVIERSDSEHIGKGYALTFLLNKMMALGQASQYDAFFVFDADNFVEPNYFTEMNKVFQAGFPVVTSFRTASNFDQNWVSSGSGIWWLREMRFVNSSRMILGNSAQVGGTGFMFSQAVMRMNDGWRFHLLTEDAEFGLNCVLNGIRIGYCNSAILYDEQPVRFSQSWQQRLRWSVGYLQVWRYYAGALVEHMVRERDLSALDFSLFLAPFTAMWFLRIIIGYVFAALGFITVSSQNQVLINWIIGLVGGMLLMMALAVLCCILERDKIPASNKALLGYCLSFPVYFMSLVPISILALISKPQWKPIAHQGCQIVTASNSESEEA